MSTTIEDRQIRRRLAILRHAEEVTGNVSTTCRYYGISRQCLYMWKRRYDELGADGLKGRSRPVHGDLGRPEVVVGGALIPVSLTLFIACEASLWGIHGGHIWYLVGLFIAISSTWWFGLFDRSETRW